MTPANHPTPPGSGTGARVGRLARLAAFLRHHAALALTTYGRAGAVRHRSHLGPNLVEVIWTETRHIDDDGNAWIVGPIYVYDQPVPPGYRPPRSRGRGWGWSR
jgi:hypothetical protein